MSIVFCFWVDYGTEESSADEVVYMSGENKDPQRLHKFQFSFSTYGHYGHVSWDNSEIAAIVGIDFRRFPKYFFKISIISIVHCVCFFVLINFLVWSNYIVSYICPNVFPPSWVCKIWTWLSSIQITMFVTNRSPVSHNDSTSLCICYYWCYHVMMRLLFILFNRKDKLLIMVDEWYLHLSSHYSLFLLPVSSIFCCLLWLSCSSISSFSLFNFSIRFFIAT